MKLQSQKQKRTTAILIGVGAVVLIAAIVLAIVLLVPNNDSGDGEMPLTTMGINIASYPKTTYYVGEDFDTTGIKVQVVMSDQSKTYFVGASELTFSGFDNSVATDSLTITVGYKEYTATYEVKIKEKPVEAPILTGIRLDENFSTTDTLQAWNFRGPNFRDVNLICTYSDGTEKSIPMQSNYASGIQRDLTSAGTTSFTIRYSEGGIQVETTVTITITE